MSEFKNMMQKQYKNGKRVPQNARQVVIPDRQSVSMWQRIYALAFQSHITKDRGLFAKRIKTLLEEWVFESHQRDRFYPYALK